MSFPGALGSTLAGIVDRPDDRPDAPVVVFSHCFTCNKDLKAIVRISRMLADQGIAVLRYDMTGLGGSEGDFSRTTFTSNQADLTAAIEFASTDLGPVGGLIGHSFGGAASLAIAGSGVTPNLQALVTLAAPSDTTHLADLLARMNPEIEAVGFGDVSIGGISWTIRREMLDDFRTHDLPSLIAQVTAKTLVFHSPVDATVSYDHAIRIQSLLQTGSGGVPASLVTLHDSDHLLAKRSEDLTIVANCAAAFFHRYRI